jgi:hypothetical protein
MAVTLNANTSTGFIATSDTSGVLQLQTGGTTAVTVDASQNVTMAGKTTNPTTISVGNATPSASGAGITFPAAISASSDANTLDDYEEGTWTPALTNLTINSGTPTYSGAYTKIGRLVFVSWVIAGTRNITITADSTFINNLPFSSATNVFGSWGTTSTLNLFNGSITSNNSIYFTNTLSSNTQGIAGSMVYTV